MSTDLASPQSIVLPIFPPREKSCTYQLYSLSQKAIDSGILSTGRVTFEHLEFQGTGFLLHPSCITPPIGQRYLLTTAHTMLHAKQGNFGYVRNGTSPSALFMIRGVQFSTVCDLALLTVNENTALGQEGLPLCQESCRLPEGTRCRFWGFPRHHRGSSPLLTFAYVSGHSQLEPLPEHIAVGFSNVTLPASNLDVAVPTLILSAPSLNGHSGSPVLNDAGEVIGMMVVKHGDLTDAMKQKIQTLASLKGVLEWQPADGGDKFDILELISDIVSYAAVGVQLGMGEALPADIIRVFLDSIPV